MERTPSGKIKIVFFFLSGLLVFIKSNKISSGFTSCKNLFIPIFGEITFKQSQKPNGKILVKPEHQDLLEISLRTGIPIEEIRQKVFMELEEFYEIEDWSY